MNAIATEIFHRVPSTATAEVDGQLVALDVQAGVCFGLNPVATRIWKLLETHDEPTGIVDVLVQDYEVDRETCALQTLALLHELVEIGLVGKG